MCAADGNARSLDAGMCTSAAEARGGFCDVEAEPRSLYADARHIRRGFTERARRFYDAKRSLRRARSHKADPRQSRRNGARHPTRLNCLWDGSEGQIENGKA